MRATLLLLLLTACSLQPPETVRVLVYNIHAGKDAGGVDNLERVADIIRTANADLVLLQEVDRGTTRSGNVDQLARLKELTGMHGVFGKSLDYQGGEYGIATLSRQPISSHFIQPLPVEPAQTRAGGSIEPRIILVAGTSAGGFRVTVANTHFDASREETYRLQEVVHLRRLLAERPEITLAGGDFNATPDSAAYGGVVGSLRDLWINCGSGNHLTYPASEPAKRIDYLFARGQIRCVSARVLETGASDHRPVLYELAVR